MHALAPELVYTLVEGAFQAIPQSDERYPTGPFVSVLYGLSDDLNPEEVPAWHIHCWGNTPESVDAYGQYQSGSYWEDDHWTSYPSPEEALSQAERALRMMEYEPADEPEEGEKHAN